MELRTPRLRLVSGTLAIAIAEMEDRHALGSLLGARIPRAWPPETLGDALDYFRGLYESYPDWEGWLGWYAIRTDASISPVLCASLGFKGAPDDDGMVEIGYSVLPAFRRQGLATEMVAALVAWAWAQPDVRVIEAETTRDNRGSMRVLERNGFLALPGDLDANLLRYRLTSTASRRREEAS